LIKSSKLYQIETIVVKDELIFSRIDLQYRDLV